MNARPCACAVLVGLAIAGRCSPVRADDAPTFADHASAAADEVERHVAFLVSPAAMAAGLFGAEVDVSVVRRVAVGIEAGVFGPGDAPVANVAVGVWFYPLADTFRGLYLSPRVVYGRPLSDPISVWGGRGEVGALGGLAGWQWSWDYGLTMRAGAGVAELLGGERGVGSAFALGSSKLALVTDASAGWLF